MSWIPSFSLRLLKSRKKLSVFLPMTLIAVCGIAFAMGAALVSLSVINGFEKAYVSAILGFNSHVVLIREGGIREPGALMPKLDPFKTTPEENDYWKRHARAWDWLGSTPFFNDPRMEDLSRRGIQAVTPFIFREGLGILPDSVAGVVLKGVDAKTMRRVYPVSYRLLAPDRGPSADPGDWIATGGEGEAPPVIVGRPLFDRFFPDGFSGDGTVKLLIPKEGDGGAQKLKDYSQTVRVVGVFESGLYEFDSQFMLTSLEVMKAMFAMRDEVSGLEIVLDDRFKAPKAARALEAHLGDAYQAVSWDELNEPLFAAMKMEKTLFLVIMLLVMLIASFNVMGIILMLILKRAPDIAILMAMGATARAINRAFAAYGAMLGLIGAALGSLLSAAILWSLREFRWIRLDPEIYFITELPIGFEVGLWLIFVGATLLICYGVARLASRTLIRRGALIQTFR